MRNNTAEKGRLRNAQVNNKLHKCFFVEYDFRLCYIVILMENYKKIKWNNCSTRIYRLPTIQIKWSNNESKL